MNTPDTFAKTSGVREFFVFPDPPERTPEDMTGFEHLGINGNAYMLREYLGNSRDHAGCRRASTSAWR